MEPKFIDKLRVQKLDGPWWKTTHRVRYNSKILDRQIVIPNGFVTDFASVPRLPVTYWFLGGKADCAALIHDYLYRFPSITKELSTNDFEARYLADTTFVEAMNAHGKPRWVQCGMFTGVRAGGWYSFGQSSAQLDPRGN